MGHRDLRANSDWVLRPRSAVSGLGIVVVQVRREERRVVPASESPAAAKVVPAG